MTSLPAPRLPQDAGENPRRGRAASLGLAAAGLALLPLLGCSGEDAETRSRRAQADVLARESEQLRRLIQAVDADKLVSPDWLAIAVDEAALQSIIEGSLNQEVLIEGRYRVVLRRAQVSFRNGYALVTLEARVSDTRRAGIGAMVVVQGGLEDFVLDDHGRLQTRVLIDHIEVQKATALTGVVDRAVGRRLDLIQDRMPALSIPVRFERSLALSGRQKGLVAISPGELPVSVKVARVLPINGRLWVFLDLSLGSWQPREASAGEAASAPAPASPPASAPSTVPAELCPPRPEPAGPVPALAAEARDQAPAPTAAARADAPTLAQIGELHKERESLRGELGEKLPRVLPAKLPAGALLEFRDPPAGGVVVGVPTGMAEEVLTLAVTGPLAETRVLVENVDTQIEGEVANPVPFTSPLGRYTVDLHLKRAEAELRPGAPQWDFGTDRIGLRLPVTLASAHASAHVRLRFEGTSRAGRLCGAVDVATDIESGLAPATHEVAGTVELAVMDNQLLVRPRLEGTSFHVALQPTDETWRAVSAVVADLRRGTNRACAAAMAGIDLEGIVQRAIARGFDVPVPAEPVREVVLPARLERVVCAGERPLRIGARPESVRITPAMMWYGKAVSLELVRVEP